MYHEGIDVHEPAVRQAQEAGWENGLDNEYTLAVFWPVLEQAGHLTESPAVRAFEQRASAWNDRLTNRDRQSRPNGGMIAVGRIREQPPTRKMLSC